MSTGPKALIAVGLLAGIVGIGVLVGWLAGRGPEMVSESPDADPSAQPANASRAPAEHTPFTYVARTAPTVSNAPTPPVVVPKTPVTNNVAVAADAAPTWEDLVDDILGANTDDPTQVKQLLAVYPLVPEEGQVEVAQHLANLVADQDYAPVRQILSNAATPPDVTDVLLSDLLNRPNAIKLPVLLDIARTPQHPNAEEARDLLGLYLDEDYGQAWTQWQQAMEVWLRENPD